ncbi:MAG: HAMP domain-containing protein [Candidatus Hydrogenedentes bacterium]|nr:HAMP domain-containing protein [Candidatus Hydrogenedentota bacterium]
MTLRNTGRGVAFRLLWRVLCVPIFVKIIGVGLVVTALFGSVAFYESRAGIYRTHYRIHGRKALSVASALSRNIEAHIRSMNLPAVDAALDRSMSVVPDVRYAIVQDTGGNILSHGFTFPRDVPPDLASRGEELCASCHPATASTEIASELVETPSDLDFPAGEMREYHKADRLIVEARVPIGPEPLGVVRLGVGDTLIADELTAISRSMIMALATCAALGILLALGLAYLIVRPIHNLVEATNQIREGDFKARAQVFSGDEIGELSTALNQMAEGLDNYKQDALEKDKARVLLIGKIVQAQEEERKNISRELHDHFGQSLSNVLLSVEALSKDSPDRPDRLAALRRSIRALIDDVRRMAWDARPSILDDYGIDHALARYVEEISKRVAFPIDYQCVLPPDAERLPSEIEVTLYRIAQEAVTNIIRHAGAGQASIILLRHDHEVSLIVEDDGQGFDLHAVQRPGDTALGLIGMEERAALVGGDFAVVSRPGAGTTVRVRIPVREETYADTAIHSG